MHYRPSPSQTSNTPKRVYFVPVGCVTERFHPELPPQIRFGRHWQGCLRLRIQRMNSCALTDAHNPWHTTFNSIMHGITKPLFLFPVLEGLLWLFPGRQREHAQVNDMGRLLERMIAQKTAEMKERSVTGDKDEAEKDLLTMMIESNELEKRVAGACVTIYQYSSSQVRYIIPRFSQHPSSLFITNLTRSIIRDFLAPPSDPASEIGTDKHPVTDTDNMPPTGTSNNVPPAADVWGYIFAFNTTGDIRFAIIFGNQGTADIARTIDNVLPLIRANFITVSYHTMDSILPVVLPTNDENVYLPELKQGVSLYPESDYDRSPDTTLLAILFATVSDPSEFPRITQAAFVGTEASSESEFQAATTSLTLFGHLCTLRSNRVSTTAGTMNLTHLLDTYFIVPLL
ncbi:hypothetical protein BC938DRAFT_481294 [Jimgerdemannia flammicorona]|uniref:Uncharacterized protein n=1 Tax=Jimgerdemannia flammicorona TaxID=994334 RepID=A0A433QGH7_9FUNG|nr:hypothetical protein BC938DRAFT_481294 [Jimgerdemannia flammicorona]